MGYPMVQKMVFISKNTNSEPVGTSRATSPIFQTHPVYQWIGLRENVQENPIFNGKNHGFLQIFPQSNDWSLRSPFFADDVIPYIHIMFCYLHHRRRWRRGMVGMVAARPITASQGCKVVARKNSRVGLEVQ